MQVDNKYNINKCINFYNNLLSNIKKLIINQHTFI